MRFDVFFFFTELLRNIDVLSFPSHSGRGGLLYAATYLQEQLGWADPVIPRNLVTAVAQVLVPPPIN